MTVGVEKTREFYEQRIQLLEGELAAARSLDWQRVSAIKWNEEQRDIQAKEIERLREEVAEVRAREADEHTECDERENNSTRIIGELRAALKDLGDWSRQEIALLREKAVVDDAFIAGYNEILRENPNMLDSDCIEAMTKLQEKCERYEKALTQIEQGYNYPRMSLAEAASIARAALDGDSVN